MNHDFVSNIIAAPFTPMNEMGVIKPSSIPDYAKKLKKDGLAGVFICGTTGEGMSLTVAERKIVAQEWIKFQDTDFKVIVHVGTTSVKQSQELGQHAQKIGAYATSTMGPLFLKPNSVNLLVDFCAEIAAAAPNIPFFYYHIPLISGIELSMVDYIDAAKSKIPNFSGVKYTHDNFEEMKKLKEKDGGKWEIFNGFDEHLIDAFSVGVNNAVGSTYNYIYPMFKSMINEYGAGNIDEAREHQIKNNEIISALFDFGGPQIAGKAIMKMLGVDCGPCRLPLSNLSEDSISNLSKKLKEIGFFELNS